MAVLPISYVRIPKQRFLDDFWPVPAPDSPHYIPKARLSKFRNLEIAARDTMKSSGGKPPADALAKVIHDYKLAGRSVDLSISVATAKGDDRWGQLDNVGDTRPSWAKPQVHVRFCSHDPFRTLEPPTNGSGSSHQKDDHEDYREQVRRDITTRVEELFTVQIITAAYVIIVHESTIRLSRWDRAGTVFSRKVDYAADPSVLVEAFWRLSMLTDVQLGMDPTATPIYPGSEEYDLMERLSAPRDDDFPHEEGAVVEGDPADPSRVFKYVREQLDECLHKWQKYPFVGLNPRWKLSVPTEDGGTREFLVGPPFHFRGPKLKRVDERNGRAYIAIDCATEKLVLLKDAWRFTDVDWNDRSLREGLVLKRLNDARVPYVPTVICESVLPDQQTRTHMYTLLPPNENVWYRENPDAGYGELSVAELHHYRMVVSEVCFDTYTCLKTGRQLVSTIRDAVFAHSRAVDVLDRLHCDISSGNIMAYPRFEVSAETGKPTVRWEGMLIDWELNRRIYEPVLPLRVRALRTWRFVSHAYIEFYRKRLTVPDELESFLYVLLYPAMRYLRSNIEDVDKWHDLFFDHHNVRTASGRPDMMSRGYIASREDPRATLEFTGLDDKDEVVYTPLDNLIKRLVWLCHARWHSKQWNGFVEIRLDVEPPCLNRGTYEPEKVLNPPPTPPEVDAAQIPASRLARKLKSHSAVLKLFDDALKEPWTMKDYVGDRMAKSNSDEKADEHKQDGAKEPEDAAEKALQPKNVNARKAAKPAQKTGVELGKRRRNPGRAARPPAPVPEERPAKRRRNPMRAARAPLPEERPAKRRRRGA